MKIFIKYNVIKGHLMMTLFFFGGEDMETVELDIVLFALKIAAACGYREANSVGSNYELESVSDEFCEKYIEWAERYFDDYQECMDENVFLEELVKKLYDEDEEVYPEEIE